MIDLRSDTLTLPDHAMLETVLSSPMGDDGRTNEDGRGEDATFNKLEDTAAAMTGKQAAVFVPTGTFGNSTAVMTWCHAGDNVLVEKDQHLLLTEKFCFDPDFGRLNPVLYHLGENQMPDPKEIEILLEQSQAKLVCLENSHNFSGGYCIDLPTMAQIRQIADRHGAKVHLDGARLFHAAAHLNVTVDQICQYADSVMFCISKGLGAPVGSLLCGTAEFCLEARKMRKLFGGVMRQAGVIAAPALYALEHNIERLNEDIENTRLIHQMLNGQLHKIGMQKDVQTNILMLDLSNAGIYAEEFCARAKEMGLLIRPVRTQYKVRLVLYKGISRQNAVDAANIILKLDHSL